MSKFYPRKQTVFIFFICVVAVAAVVFYVRGTNTDKVALTGHLSVINEEKTSAQIVTETDWKKSFFEKSTSTVSAGKVNPSTGSTITEKLTATDQLGRSFFSQYINLKSTGLNNDSDIVNSTVSGLLNQDYIGMEKPKIYSQSDIKIIQNNDSTSLKAYGETVGSILINNSPQKDDASIALAGMKKENLNYVAELNANMTKYKTIIKLLLATPAPQSVSAYHLGLTNGISEMLYVASSLRASETDPMLAISSLGTYQEAFSLLSENVLAIRDALVLAGISYGSSSGGSYFTSIK